MIFNVAANMLEVVGCNDKGHFKLKFYAEDEEIIPQIKIEDFINHYGCDDILKLIGAEKVKEYLNIKEIS